MPIWKDLSTIRFPKGKRERVGDYMESDYWTDNQLVLELEFHKKLKSMIISYLLRYYNLTEKPTIEADTIRCGVKKTDLYREEKEEYEKWKEIRQEEREEIKEKQLEKYLEFFEKYNYLLKKKIDEETAKSIIMGDIPNFDQTIFNYIKYNLNPYVTKENFKELFNKYDLRVEVLAKNYYISANISEKVDWKDIIKKSIIKTKPKIKIEPKENKLIEEETKKIKYTQDDIEEPKVETKPNLELKIKSKLKTELKLLKTKTLKKLNVNKNGFIFYAENIQKIGEWGEEAIYQLLQEEYKDKDVEIIWKNKDGESGEHFDILLINNGKEYFIEVKTTITNKKEFIITEGEFRLAKLRKEQYVLYLIINAGEDDASYEKIENFYEKYQSKRFERISKRLRYNDHFI